MTQETFRTKPVKTFKHGLNYVSIWENRSEGEKPYLTVTFRRR